MKMGNEMKFEDERNQRRKENEMSTLNVSDKRTNIHNLVGLKI